jgi:hypothetical protein
MGSKLVHGDFEQHINHLVSEFNHFCPPPSAALPWATHDDVVNVNAIMTSTNGAAVNAINQVRTLHLLALMAFLQQHSDMYHLHTGT